MSAVTGPGAHVSGQSNTPLSRPPHALRSEAVLHELKSDASTGLSLEGATRRLQEHGFNELERKKGVQPLKIFLEQILNAMTLVLVLALAASFAIEAWIEGGVLGGVIVLNIFIGFFQTLDAERTIDSLRTLGSPTSRVFRDDRTVTISTSEVVPGDIIDLAVGDSVPADIRLIEAVNLEADESLLTGESAPVLKIPGSTFSDETGPGDRLNVVYSSTTITKGRGRGVVFATGMFTEIGLIAHAINSDDDKPIHKDESPSVWSFLKNTLLGPIFSWLGEFLGLTVGTPLQKKLSQLFVFLFIFAIICAIVVLGVNEFDTRKDIIIYAITVAIGMVPVSLLLVLTLTMAAGARKMVDRHVIVRSLSSLEALGGVTNICSDKTGTITQGRMVARSAWLPGHGTYNVEATKDTHNPTAGLVFFTPSQPKDGDSTQVQNLTVTPADELAEKPALRWYLNIATLAGLAKVWQSRLEDSEKPGVWKAEGAPTEAAIEVFAQRFGWNRVGMTQGDEAKWQHLVEFPFDSDVKKMTVIFKDAESGEAHVFTKGAVERVLDNCATMASGETTSILTDQDHTDIQANMETLAARGLRVLALAHRLHQGDLSEADFNGTQPPRREDFEHNLVFRGLIGIYDPPRPETLSSVRACQGAGVEVHMLTGDHPETARAIAAEVGILPSPSESRLLPTDVLDSMAMPAHVFDAMTDEEVDSLPQLPLVVARCAPSTKVRMIQALHRRGRYVAMTGDGVNDSPSLKRADIGIAMGSGSDVAKESSDIILTDDNFASILNAVEEGRRIFDNIQKFILHVLAANIGYVITLLVGLCFKDDTGVSVFQLTPIEIIWMLLTTGAFCETGLGFEKAVPDIMNRPPHDLKYGVFNPELLVDMFAYGTLIGACGLGSFAAVIYGFSSGSLGKGCNTAYSPSCTTVFRARSTCYSTVTWVFLMLAWELVDFRRSFFDMPHGFKAWARHLWENQFLFYSVTVAFVLVFPALYIPGLNHVVFLHEGITWEWAVVFVAVGVYVVLTEAWKWTKRVYFRRRVCGKQRGWEEKAEV